MWKDGGESKMFSHLNKILSDSTLTSHKIS